jgi:hypothetical protein
MTLYDDSPHPVREAIGLAHVETLETFVRPGTWWTGAQRAALVAEARASRVAAGLQEPLRDALTDSRGVSLPDAARTVVHQVAVAPKDLERGFYDAARADGLSDCEFVETVGVVSRVVAVDVFARGIGVPIRSLPAIEPGEPARERPATARAEGAWVDTVPSGRCGGTDAIAIYGDMQAPFVYRALSLAPPEAAGVILFGNTHYVQIDDFMDLDFSYDPQISRPEVEFLAGRVSAINECFY